MPPSRLPAFLAVAPATYVLLALNIAMFFLQLQDRQHLLEYALWPPGEHFAPWQIITSAFLHADAGHLATNMFGLWMFGRDVEQVLGLPRYLALYGASLLTAALSQLLVQSLMADPNPSLGASGALFGILLAFAMIFPRRMVMLLILPIPMQARVFVVLYAAFELYSGVTGTFSGVAHFAHLGGLVGGLACMAYWKRRRV